VRRAELEHVIRAAAEVVGDDELVVIGSQAILGQFHDAPESLLISREADIYPKNHPERADEIDGSLGDGSYFDSSFGYYARAVGPETAKAPAGWESRLVPVQSENTGNAIGWCLDVHDLVLSKCAADRERDWDFAREALLHRLADPGELQRRAAALPMPAADTERIQRMLAAII
jgi:hypothetical protein